MKPAYKRPFSIILLFTTVTMLGLNGTRNVKARVDPPSERLPSSNFFLASSAFPTPTIPANNTATPTPPDLNLQGLNAAGPNPNIDVFIQAPTGALKTPYVILSASQIGSDLSNLQITGFINSTDFVCAGTPCTIILGEGQSSIVFKAQTASGETSREVIASVRVDTTSNGYLVVLESVSQYYAGFGDACLKIWGITDYSDPAWAEFPQFPYQLNTQITLHGLVTNLILHGVVDVKDCPSGGLNSDLAWPTGCGLARAKDAMIAWQNQYDDNIWQTGKQVGIPPKILKTLLEIESQFWPGNQRFYVDEFGLGQINQLGLDALLRSNYDLYQSACTSVLNNCVLPYLSQSPAAQRMIRGALTSSLDASCATCANGIDLTKAKQSIPLIAQVLKADCQQTKNVMDSRGATASYEDFWKFTLLVYHSGLSCLDDTVASIKVAGDPMNWESATKLMHCSSDAQKYVDGFWASLTSFDANLYSPGELVDVKYEPVVLATHTPQPTATSLASHAQIFVKVFMDNNADGIAQESELLNGISVEVTSDDGRVLSAVTQQGQALFDMSSYSPDTLITVSLPGLYRSYTLTLPEQGIVPVVFIFQNPGLPNKLP